ncbi:MAG: hypothetical protein JO327_11605 [Nitrososphaeraceae archaeon]|nr:hypothetical protein [Nitrososphaeraceae archaeon]MBV9668761.1 hypothetical protein [Nitrososphaeraceae archaeon]
MTTKYTTIIGIIIAALAVSLLVAGPNLVLLKQHQGYAAAASHTKQQEQKTRQQENQCLTAGKCSKALGEQTQGNDNSVTVFTDQSSNVQSRVVTVTPNLHQQPKQAMQH